MPPTLYQQDSNRQFWLRHVFWPAWIVQEAMAFAIPILAATAGKLLYKLIPHKGDNIRLLVSPNVQMTGGTPEEVAPMMLAIGFAICDFFALIVVVVCFVEVFLLKCCCRGFPLNPVTYAIINLLLCFVWVWCSGQIGGVLWEYEHYMGIHLLEEPIWWAAFALQVIYGLAFLIPALASIRFALRGLWTEGATDEERRPLIFFIEDRSDDNRNYTAPPNYGS